MMLALKMKARTVVGRERRACLRSDPWSELRVGKGERKNPKVIDGMSQNANNKQTDYVQCEDCEQPPARKNAHRQARCSERFRFRQCTEVYSRPSYP